MEENTETMIITMTDDETGEEIDFAVIDAVEYQKKRYILVVEENQLEDDEAEAIIFRVVENERNKEEVFYQTITDDKEFEEIQEIFMEKDIEEFEILNEE